MAAAHRRNADLGNQVSVIQDRIVSTIRVSHPLPGLRGSLQLRPLHHHLPGGVPHQPGAGVRLQSPPAGGGRGPGVPGGEASVQRGV